MNIDLRLGDCIEVMRTLPDNSVDSIITDPPYGIGMMNKEWDSPKKHKELIDRETQRSQERFEEGKSPVKGGFSKGVQPGLPIGGAKEGRWFQEWCELWAEECYRVLKPGGYMLSFSAPRTYHRMATAFEEVGFQVRDQIMWLFGSGFPKSHNIGKAIDKIQGNEREVVGRKIQRVDGTTRNLQPNGGFMKENMKTKPSDGYVDIEKPGSEDSEMWEGWGTALKPAHEPICMARKPLSEKSIAENVLKWGTGGINIDGSRIGSEVRTTPIHSDDVKDDNTLFGLHKTIQHERVETTEGRFPANLIVECICDNSYTKPAPKSGHWSKTTTKGFGEFGNGSSTYEGVGEKESGNMVIHTNPECPCYMLDEQSGVSKTTKRTNFKKNNTIWQDKDDNSDTMSGGFNDKGGASRFFYSPKVSKKERNAGLDDLPDIVGDITNIASKRLKCRTCGKWYITSDNCKCENPDWIEPTTKNNHPTVKPLALMKYLIKMITPPNGVVLEPFLGSGSTGVAAKELGFVSTFIGIEKEQEYMDIAIKRIGK